ncbi:Hypothetical protein FKW44_017070, partial [Caligus rogercresseyi]
DCSMVTGHMGLNSHLYKLGKLSTLVYRLYEKKTNHLSTYLRVSPNKDGDERAGRGYGEKIKNKWRIVF